MTILNSIMEKKVIELKVVKKGSIREEEYDLSPLYQKLGFLIIDEKEEVKEQIKTFKKYYNLTHEGEYYRLTNPMENRLYAAWEFVSQDQSEALVHGMQILAQPSGPSIHIPVRGLKADAMYEVNGELVRSGRALMHGGLNFPRQTGDFKAVEFYLKEVK